MKTQTFISFFSLLGCIVNFPFFSPKSIAQPVRVNTSVPDLVLNGNPAGIKWVCG